jgi:hypothetical protein
LEFDHLFGQTITDPLFKSQKPLNIAFRISIDNIRNTKRDSIYISHKLYYGNDSGHFDSIDVNMKSRGNFRLKECYFPPLLIKIERDNTKGTVFEGNKKLKLVLSCRDRKGNNELILKEFLCYKLYEELTPYSFRTRLADITLTEERGKKNKIYKLKGIFIEDMDKIAKRLKAKRLTNIIMSPAALNDTNAFRLELFQFMISNTDWSSLFQHNAKLIEQGPGKNIALIYDFDMSGLVNAPYAVVSEINGEQLDISSVTERRFRGFCHSPQVMEFVRKEFLSIENRLLTVPDQLKGDLSDKEIEGIRNFLKQFFIIIKDDHLFKNDIVDNCRAK